MSVVIKQDENLLSLEEVYRVPSEVQCGDDVQLSVKVISGKFSAEVNAFFDQPRLQTFVRGLTELERTREGLAELSTMYSDEVWLRFAVADGWGHTRVEGMLINYDVRGVRPCRHSIEFGFDFDPTFLPAAVAGFAKFCAT